MKISVVIPAYNEEKNIEKCIKSLLSQAYSRDDYEIIVVDGGSKDRTVEIAQNLGAKVISQKSRYIEGARNDGAFMARGGIVAFTDADIVLHDNWLKTIEKNFDSDIQCVFGPLLPSKNTGFYRALFYLGNKMMYAGSRTNLFHNICGANCAFRKEAFMKLNGFRELSAAEDVEIGVRLKKLGRIYFDKKMKVRYSTRRIEKFGLMKILPVWISNSFNALRNRSREANYAKMDYS